MNRRKICASITSPDPRAIKVVEPLVDLFEVRIDLIGESWPAIPLVNGRQRFARLLRRIKFWHRQSGTNRSGN